MVLVIRTKKENCINWYCATNSFEIKKHGYKTGEIIRYTAGSSTVSGLVDSKDYYVRKLVMISSH